MTQRSSGEVSIGSLIEEQSRYSCKLLSVKGRAKPRQATLNYIGILPLPQVYVHNIPSRPAAQKALNLSTRIPNILHQQPTILSSELGILPSTGCSISTAIAKLPGRVIARRHIAHAGGAPHFDSAPTAQLQLRTEKLNWQEEQICSASSRPSIQSL